MIGQEDTKIRIVALNSKYRDKPLFISAPWSNSQKKYLTGQSLSLNKMTGKQKLTEKEMELHPIVINPNEQYPVVHASVLDLAKKEDLIMYNFYKLASDVIAQSKKVARKGRHLFYIENAEKESQENVKSFDAIFEAMKKVKEDLSMERLSDLGIYLGYESNKLSKSRLMDKVLTDCSNNPAKVMEFFSEGAQDILFVAKLHHYQIIKRDKDSYFDGNRFLGRTYKEIVNFMYNNDNKMLLGKWKNVLSQKEHGVVLPEEKEEVDIDLIRRQERERIRLENMEGIEKLRQSARGKKYPNEEWENFKEESELIEYLVSKVE